MSSRDDRVEEHCRCAIDLAIEHGIFFPVSREAAWHSVGRQADALAYVVDPADGTLRDQITADADAIAVAGQVSVALEVARTAFSDDDVAIDRRVGRERAFARRDETLAVDRTDEFPKRVLVTGRVTPIDESGLEFDRSRVRAAHLNLSI